MKSDSEIVRQIRQGHKELLSEIVEKYYPVLFRFAFIRVHDRDIALDLVQETFYKFYKHIERVNERHSVLPYLLQILKNLHHNFKYRYARRMRKIEDFFFQSTEPGADQRLIEKETHIQLMNALKKLSSEDQTILILREFENYSYKELAEFFNVSEGTIMSRLHYARKKLKKAYEEVTHETV
jgi:RNA polymerase sigma-70 factor (ECF subfamily)